MVRTGRTGLTSTCSNFRVGVINILLKLDINYPYSEPHPSHSLHQRPAEKCSRYAGLMQPMLRRSQTPGESNVEKDPVLCVRCSSDHILQWCIYTEAQRMQGSSDDMEVLHTFWCCSGAYVATKRNVNNTSASGLLLSEYIRCMAYTGWQPSFHCL